MNIFMVAPTTMLENLSKNLSYSKRVVDPGHLERRSATGGRRQARAFDSGIYSLQR